MRVRIVICLLLLAACGPGHELRKAQRLMDRAIAKGAKVKSDTVKVTKTVIVPGDSVRVEIPVWSKVRDTTIYQDRAVLKIVHHHDTVRVSAECLPDTVRITVPVTIHKSIECPPQGHTWRTVALVAIGLLLAIIALLVLRR